MRDFNRLWTKPWDRFHPHCHMWTCLSLTLRITDSIILFFFFFLPRPHLNPGIVQTGWWAVLGKKKNSTALSFSERPSILFCVYWPHSFSFLGVTISQTLLSFLLGHSLLFSYEFIVFHIFHYSIIYSICFIYFSF